MAVVFVFELVTQKYSDVATVSIFDCFFASFASMAKEKTNRGRVIYYDRVPDDVMDKILLTQLSIKQKSKRTKVSLSEAITKLIRTAT